jgi:hypothetical protein
MKDGTELTAFISNGFVVHEYVITVCSYVGDINSQLLSNGYVYDIDNAALNVLAKATIGHATWQVEIDNPSNLSSTTKWTKYVNIPCGFGVAQTGKDTFIKNLKTYPVSGLSVNAPGYLIIGDSVNYTNCKQNKQFKMSNIQTEKVLDKVSNIDTATPDYILHSNNCVDTSMAVAKEGGVTFKTTCRKQVTILKDSDFKSADISLPSELANELK